MFTGNTAPPEMCMSRSIDKDTPNGFLLGSQQAHMKSGTSPFSDFVSRALEISKILQWRQTATTIPSANHGRETGPLEKKKPVFVKVDQLKPGTSGHTLTVKVVDHNSVPPKPGAASSHLRPSRISECLVGDDTASILFTARNDQVELMKPGATVNLRNAKIDMFKGSMRLAVDKWGRIEVLPQPLDITVKHDNNLSLVEYELVNVEE